MCQGVGVSSCMGAAVKIAPSGCNQPEEQRGGGSGTATALMVFTNTLISFLERLREMLGLGSTLTSPPM